MDEKTFSFDAKSEQISEGEQIKVVTGPEVNSLISILA